jgi:hypothetical protein
MKIILKKIIFIVITNLLGSCNTQTNKNELHISDFEFKSIVSNYKGDKSQGVYCILGKINYNLKHSDNFIELLKEWIKNHPNSKVIPVTSMNVPDANNPNSKLVYCWIIDGNENLNTYLVKNGCVEGKSMNRLRTWEQMNKEKSTTDRKDLKLKFLSKTIFILTS